MKIPNFSIVPVTFLLSAQLSLVACNNVKAEEDHHQSKEHETTHPIVVTTPLVRDVDVAEHYVCQIRASRHIELRALERGYLQQIMVKEGQAVKKGQLLFKLLPAIYKARLHADEAELERADINLRNTEILSGKAIVSEQELAMAKAERARASARVELATAELNFTEIRAPFDGIVDRQYEQQGSLLEEGDMLTTVSDNELLWVYFNVPEADYLDFQSHSQERDPNHPEVLKLPGARLRLQLANGTFFEHSASDSITIESDFDNETGNIPFRADFPNPERLLRHGQTGTLWIHTPINGGMIIPQRATFEILDKRYVYVVDEKGIAHQRLIEIESELDDVFVVQRGLRPDEKIVIEGVKQVEDGQHIQVRFKSPEAVLSNMKMHAE